ncbi:MAG: U32 family peptidase [Deltaproteobacteria bacterium]|nr:U32 family peptidase [Deltaproteobacteria bacterium]
MKQNTKKKRKRTQKPLKSGADKRKPEILAPAGSLATFAAAIDAGADSVYLGLKEFSARAFAANFSLADLARLVPLAHERGVKIYVAFNSLLKEEDLIPAARLLESLAQIKPDALILQDLGILRLIKRHFPVFELHASTLMGSHNLPGLHMLKQLGFDRAVLARELTLKEINTLTRHTDLGLEIFVHGALCFSFSGLCLMSSFLGGKGSLRGACTQPCRRRYTSGKKSAYFFSPTDLNASELLRSIKELDLAALKIEGRMKGAHYVGNVVRAYRLLVDSSNEAWEQNLAEARRLIDDSLGREGSAGFFMAPHPAQGLAPSRSATSGKFLGRIEGTANKGGRIILKSDVEIGDRLRTQFKRNQERQAFTLKEMTRNGAKIKKALEGEEVMLNAPFPLAAGDLIFKVDAAEKEKQALNSSLIKEFKNASKPKIRSSRNLKPILDELKTGAEPASAMAGRSKPEIWYRVARSEDVPGLSELKPDRIILPLTRSNLKRASRLKRRRDRLMNKVIWALPPLLFGPEVDDLYQDLLKLKQMDFAGFFISSLSHVALLNRSAVKRPDRRLGVYADYRLNCLNTQAEAQLKDLGLNGVTLSIESDEKNFRQILSRRGSIARLLYIYGRPPLFTSRFLPAGLKDNLAVVSPRKERFRVRRDRDVFQTFAEQPVFMAPLLKLKPLAGVKAFLVDLEFDPHPQAKAREVKESIKRNRPIRGSSRFNLKRGLH